MAAIDLIDYAGIGGVYRHHLQGDQGQPIGNEGLARVAAALRARRPGFPVCGIAGINAANAAAVIAAGADGVR